MTPSKTHSQLTQAAPPDPWTILLDGRLRAREAAIYFAHAFIQFGIDEWLHHFHLFSDAEILVISRWLRQRMDHGPVVRVMILDHHTVVCSSPAEANSEQLNPTTGERAIVRSETIHKAETMFVLNVSNMTKRITAAIKEAKESHGKETLPEVQPSATS